MRTPRPTFFSATSSASRTWPVRGWRQSSPRASIRKISSYRRLLVEVTLHKLYRRAAHHLAQRRSVRREQSGAGLVIDDTFRDKQPTPDEATAAADELEAVLAALSAEARSIVELRLQGFEHQEIAERLNCSERTVRRRLNEARRLLAARGGSDFMPSAARLPAARGPRPLTTPPQPTSVEAPLVWTDYILREQIGVGATGRVYRAVHKQSDRDVAVKFLRKSLLGNFSAVQRFLREARTLSGLSHPGIVPIQGAGRTPGGGLFLVMELVRGMDLLRVARARRVTVDEAVQWTIAAAGAVQFVHEHGVIHCDLKPSNVLLDVGGQIRVTDFGLAVRLWQIPADTALLAGTPGFMAPEQVDPCWGEISPRTDVWGLGSMLYFLLFGRPPHSGSDTASILATIVSRSPVLYPQDARESVPAALLRVLERSLTKSPPDRMASSAEFADALYLSLHSA
jgi:RNA polymerase sigma factor (sigma-70 family)